ncbi:hypothetical protein [Fluviicola sp.]|uniref:hypothetical protein n=1 Tax=Fluviicola sp. TaxID=1917219 RepID=UPI003D2ADC58
MNRLVYLLFFVFIFVSCGENEEKSPDYFVIQPFVADSLDEGAEPVFYGDHNFILADSEKIYYHDNSGYSRGMCGTGIDFTKPPQLFLTPDSLKEIKKEDLLDFLKTTTKKRGHYLLVSISSPVDTIRNNAVFIIRNFYENKKKTYLGIRKFTEEEEYVVRAKLTNKVYDPRKIKWKTGFSIETPPVSETIKFIPPEISH